jgi:outer membrane protein TolC
LDWGVAKHKRKKAEAIFHNTTLSVEQDQLDFYRRLHNTVRQYNLQLSQLRLMQRKGELSEKRFEMSKERYITGKINFLDYSVAQNEKDNSQITYIQALQKSWSRYYEIRKLTLFDFIGNKKIEAEPLHK